MSVKSRRQSELRLRSLFLEAILFSKEAICLAIMAFVRVYDRDSFFLFAGFKFETFNKYYSYGFCYYIERFTFYVLNTLKCIFCRND